MRTVEKVECYKLVKPDGYDFYTGKTISYRGDSKYPHDVCVPNPNSALGICSSGVIHASKNPNDCFAGAKIPCSAYRVLGRPVAGDSSKYGFLELTVLEEIFDLDELFGWRYSEAINPINPLIGNEKKPTRSDIALLNQWASVKASVGDSVWVSVRDSVGALAWDSAWALVWASVRDSVRDSVRAYVGSLFPEIREWKYIKHETGKYPYQAAVDLWRRNLVPSFDGKIWRLHSGAKAKIVYEGEISK